MKGYYIIWKSKKYIKIENYFLLNIFSAIFIMILLDKIYPNSNSLNNLAQIGLITITIIGMLIFPLIINLPFFIIKNIGLKKIK